MSKLCVESFTISQDGFGAGPDQDLNNPLGVGGTSLHGWATPTRTFQENPFGNDGWPWPDESWRGWWGDNPVYQVPIFVLTHHAREAAAGKDVCTHHVTSPKATHIALSKQ